MLQALDHLIGVLFVRVEGADEAKIECLRDKLPVQHIIADETLDVTLMIAGVHLIKEQDRVAHLIELRSVVC